MAITVGLDFGTHQTKVCLEDKSDKLHPLYRFLYFKDLNGEDQIILPSVIQINKDDTLSYGFIDESKAKKASIFSPEQSQPAKPSLSEVIETMKAEPAVPTLPTNPRKVDENAPEWMCKRWEKDCLYIKERYLNLKESWKKHMLHVWGTFKKQKEEYDLYQKRKECAEESKCIFRYFKISSISSYRWPYNISCDTLSICFLAFIILKLEQIYGQNFSIQMGIPTGKDNAKQKKYKAVRLLTSAYRLAEDIYEGDLEKFLNAKFQDLEKEAVLLDYSEDLKEEYFIKILPEAYAGLVTLTSRNKLVSGMNLLVDIGGGTTDISFFEIVDKKPVIYNFESLPNGINYIVEKSLKKGIDIFEIKADLNSIHLDLVNKSEAISQYKQKLIQYSKSLVGKIYNTFRDSGIDDIPMKSLENALRNRLLVYTGGGSMYDDLCNPLYSFSEVKHMKHSDWNGIAVEGLNKIKNLCPVLSVALGLSMETSSDEITLHNVKELFRHLVNEREGYTKEYGLLDD